MVREGHTGVDVFGEYVCVCGYVSGAASTCRAELTTLTSPGLKGWTACGTALDIMENSVQRADHRGAV